MLNEIEMIEGDINDLKDVYAQLLQDFAENEIKDYAHLELLMSMKKYKLLLARHKVFNEMIGYAFVYETGHNNMLWLDYMAIDTKFQGAGYGTQLFNKIAEIKQEGTIGMFMEVEIPDHENETTRENQIRRIKFYERLGAKRLKFDYQLPTPNGGLPMYLYFKPSPDFKILPKEQIKETITSAFEYIHSDMSERNTILKTFLDTITDEPFN